MKRPKPLTYQERITKAMQAMRLPPGTLSRATVAHDSWCPCRNGRPGCKCVPDITITGPFGSVTVGRDGTPKTRAAN